MPRIFYHAEQTGNKVAFFDSNGSSDCLVTDVENYVEEQRLNYADIDGEEVRLNTDVEYVDDNWDSVTFNYWKHIIHKGKP